MSIKNKINVYVYVYMYMTVLAFTYRCDSGQLVHLCNEDRSFDCGFKSGDKMFHNYETKTEKNLTHGCSVFERLSFQCHQLTFCANTVPSR